MKELVSRLNQLEKKNISYYDALVIQDRFVTEIQKKMDELKITKKSLAKEIGVSASYITQVFQGRKFFNMNLLAAIQNFLEIDFKIQAVDKGDLETSGTLFYKDSFLKNLAQGKTKDINPPFLKPEYDKLVFEDKSIKSELKTEKAA